MAMSKKLARSIIVAGIMELFVACISAILGGINLVQFHCHPSSSVGLWTLDVSTHALDKYFVV